MCSSVQRSRSKVTHACHTLPQSGLSSFTTAGIGGPAGCSSRRRGDCHGEIVGGWNPGRIGVAMIILRRKSLSYGTVRAHPLIPRQNKKLVALGPTAKAASLTSRRLSVEHLFQYGSPSDGNQTALAISQELSHTLAVFVVFIIIVLNTNCTCVQSAAATL